MGAHDRPQAPRPVTTCTVPACDRDAVARGICDLHRARRRAGIPDDAPVQRHPTRAEVAAALPRMIEMRQQGAELTDIAAAVGISAETVSKHLRAAGIGQPSRSIPHGTPSGWQYHRCDCDVCRDAKRVYKRDERRRRLARARITADHGTRRAYAQGCDCDACRTAVARASAERVERTRPGAHRHGARWTQQDAETAMRTDITIEERAALLGRTYAAVDDWIRAYLRRPDDPHQVKP